MGKQAGDRGHICRSLPTSLTPAQSIGPLVTCTSVSWPSRRRISDKRSAKVCCQPAGRAFGSFSIAEATKGCSTKPMAMQRCLRHRRACAMLCCCSGTTPRTKRQAVTAAKPSTRSPPHGSSTTGNSALHLPPGRATMAARTVGPSRNTVSKASTSRRSRFCPRDTFSVTHPRSLSSEPDNTMPAISSHTALPSRH